MRRGENPSLVLARVKAGSATDLNDRCCRRACASLRSTTGSIWWTRTLHTVTHSVVSGIALVLLVLLAFLGRPWSRCWSC